MKNTKFLLLILFSCFTKIGLSQVPGSVIVTEIMQNPDFVTDANGEWFEVYNTRATSIDMDGWTIKDNGANNHVINNGGPLIIQPHGFLLFARNGNTGTNGGMPVDYVIATSFTLVNTTDAIILKTPGGVTIDSVVYDGGPIWPNPTGASMTYTGCPADDNNDGSLWVEATVRENNYDLIGTDFGSPQTQGVDQNMNTVYSNAVTQPSCGLNDGMIDITITGCGGPFSYTWSTADTTEDLVGIGGGTYIVTVTGIGFNVTDTFDLDFSTPLTISDTTTDAGCPTFTNGTIDLTVGGGTPGYTFLWSNGAITEDLSGLSPGTFTVTVTDTTGCSIMDTAVVNTVPGSLTVSGVALKANCTAAANGKINLTVSGGIPTITYNWSTGDNIEDISGLVPGWYFVTVTDGGGCSKVDSFFVDSLAPITLNFNPTDVTCFGFTDGMCEVLVTNGMAPYTYLWSDSQTGSTAINLPAGMISVVVTDSLGCSAEDSATVAGPTQITSSTSSTPETGATSNGTATVIANGGTPAYTYLWSNGGVTGTITGIPAGTYFVTVTDANGCTVIDTVVVAQINAITQNDFSSGIKVYPVPANDFLQIMYDGNEIISNLKIVNVSGVTVMDVKPGMKKDWNVNVSTLSAGVYSLILVSDKGAGVKHFIIE